jgi:hypothetical protein
MTAPGEIMDEGEATGAAAPKGSSARVRRDVRKDIRSPRSDGVRGCSESMVDAAVEVNDLAVGRTGRCGWGWGREGESGEGMFGVLGDVGVTMDGNGRSAAEEEAADSDGDGEAVDDDDDEWWMTSGGAWGFFCTKPMTDARLKRDVEGRFGSVCGASATAGEREEEAPGDEGGMLVLSSTPLLSTGLSEAAERCERSVRDDVGPSSRGGRVGHHAREDGTADMRAGGQEEGE